MIRMIIKYFLPWIVYYFTTKYELLAVKPAITVTLALSIAFNYKDIKNQFLIDTVIFVFTLFVFLNIWFLKIKLSPNLITTLIYSSLALLSLISLFRKKPFTIRYAKKRVPDKLWEEDAFLKINYILTVIWFIIFCINSTLSVVWGYLLLPFWSYLIIKKSMVLGGIYISYKYPKLYYKKL